jgi:hypothetical protein
MNKLTRKAPLAQTAFILFTIIGCMGVADLDNDGDVDSDDFGLFDACTSGPAVALTPGCEDVDSDSDNDVDMSDFGSFQTCYSGSNVLAASSCLPTTDDGCPNENFLDVSQAPGAGANYPRPSLSISCTNTTMVVRSNDIPHYTFVQVTPNALRAQNFTWTVPLNPQVAASTTSIPLLGTIGFAVNGLAIYGPNEGAMPTNQAYGDPIYNDIMDEAQGHTAQSGDYHYHALLQKVLVPSGLVAEPWLNPDPSPNEASPIIAYAFDGFPIYGPYCCVDVNCTSVIEMRSSYVQTGNPRTYAWNAYTYTQQSGSQYLDRCNGHTGPRGDYHYHMTSTFPYILGCYRGTVLANKETR